MKKAVDRGTSKLETDHYFLGGGMKNFPLQTFFLLMHLCKHFFRNSYYFLLYISFLQTVYFVFPGPANSFLNIFHPPSLQKNNGPSLSALRARADFNARFYFTLLLAMNSLNNIIDTHTQKNQ